jgi:hypothetical protein
LNISDCKSDLDLFITAITGIVVTFVLYVVLSKLLDKRLNSGIT